MKKNNPQIPILLREAAGTSPRVYARYGGFGWTSHVHCPPMLTDMFYFYAEFGHEKSEPLEGRLHLLVSGFCG